MVTLTVDGQEVQAEEGLTLLEVARGIGIEIPTLCYHEAVSPYGACRLCVVEVVKGARSTVSTSCTYPVEEGIEVKTNSPRVIGARKMIVELLLARCPNVKTIRDLADQLGIEKPRFKEEEGEECILCGLCVRVCQEVVGKSVLGFVDRGVERRVTTPFDMPAEACIGCGACALVCPTGAIQIEGEGQVLHSDLYLGPPSAIYVPILQAVPKIPVIDRQSCIHFQTGGCQFCQEVCEPGAINHEMEEETLELDVGTIILATGFSPFDPSHAAQFGYGLDNVLTGLEFERLINASGPTGGKVLLKDGTTPESIAILHCIGSRDEEYNAYCSRVCCMYSLKFAHLVRETTGARVYEVYRDMRAFGKGYEEFFARVEHEGITFIRRSEEIEVRAIGHADGRQDGRLLVKARDVFSGQQVELAVDMVILGVGMVPRQDAGQVARLFGIGCGDTGFFTERHPKLAPVETASEGIFIAGACQGPKDIPDTVAQAGAAAVAALDMIDLGAVKLEPITSFIDEEVCSGCRTCIGLCPYSAIEFVRLNGKGVSRVNEALCKGCGTCVSACPSGAATQRGFVDRQIVAEIEGALQIAVTLQA